MPAHTVLFGEKYGLNPADCDSKRRALCDVTPNNPAMSEFQAGFAWAFGLIANCNHDAEKVARETPAHVLNLLVDLATKTRAHCSTTAAFGGLWLANEHVELTEDSIKACLAEGYQLAEQVLQDMEQGLKALLQQKHDETLEALYAVVHGQRLQHSNAA